MGELLFNSNIFLKQASRKLFEKSTRSMTSCIFNAVSLLKTIDSKTGSLNDSAADEYAKIEQQANETSPLVGKSMLRPRRNINCARKYSNGLVARLFTIEVNDTAPLAKTHKDMVLFEPERLLRFMIDVFKLKGKSATLMHHWRWCRSVF